MAELSSAINSQTPEKKKKRKHKTSQAEHDKQIKETSQFDSAIPISSPTVSRKPEAKLKTVKGEENRKKSKKKAESKQSKQSTANASSPLEHISDDPKPTLPRVTNKRVVFPTEDSDEDTHFAQPLTAIDYTSAHLKTNGKLSQIHEQKAISAEDPDSDEGLPDELSVSTPSANPKLKLSLKRKYKLEQKEKNRQRDELFKAQKRAKLDLLKVSDSATPNDSADPLPDFVLEKVADAELDPSKVQKSKHTVFRSEPDPQNDDGDSGISVTSKITAVQVSKIQSPLSATAVAFRKKFRRGQKLAQQPTTAVNARKLQLQEEKQRFVFKTKMLAPRVPNGTGGKAPGRI